MKRPVLVAAVLAAFLSLVGTAPAAVRAAKVAVYPAATAIRPSGAIQGRSRPDVSLAVAIGEREDAVIAVSGAQQVRVDAATLAGPLQLSLRFAHYVSFGGSLVPDALLPWDGSERRVEHPNQPLWLQVVVPPGTAPGTYSGSVTVVADATPHPIAINVRVFPVALPASNEAAGSLLTGFHVAAESYGNVVNRLYGVSPTAAVPRLYQFLASYRISPNSWGYGAPRFASGYSSDRRWWYDNTTQMQAAVGARDFAAMAIPISNNRTAPHNYIGGLSPSRPETWCSYLQSVHTFWQSRGWLASYPFLYGEDEPGLAGFRLVARQAQVLHRCFPGGHALVTGNPSLRNRLVWNGGSDDVDDWVVLASRYYGKYTVPLASREGRSNATAGLRLIDGARRRGAAIWTYTYPNTGTPSFTATEPLSDSRLLFEWAALEGLRGVLYGEGTTSYLGGGSPLDAVDRKGAFVLVYPGRDGPIPSARLEQIRDGIEDWEILSIVRAKRGAAAVRSTLSSLFSTTPGAVELGCTIGCALRTSTPFSWPRWSHDASTPAKLVQAKLRALTAAS